MADVASDVLRKLGFRVGLRTHIVGLPEDLAPLFAPALRDRGLPPDWTLIFAPDKAALDQAAREDVARYTRGGHLWVAYPKQSSGIATDITRDRGWEAFDALDLHGVSQISVSPVWSALRFRYRDEIRSFTRKF
ncbi:MAG: hypothetical protein ACK4GT_20400 [Pararhodobacter sp.]